MLYTRVQQAVGREETVRARRTRTYNCACCARHGFSPKWDRECVRVRSNTYCNDGLVRCSPDSGQQRTKHSRRDRERFPITHNVRTTDSFSLVTATTNDTCQRSDVAHIYGTQVVPRVLSRKAQVVVERVNAGCNVALIFRLTRDRMYYSNTRYAG